MAGMFILAYLWATARQAIESTGRADLVGALIVATLTVAVGIGWLPWSANDLLNIGFWVAVGLVVWFLAMVLVVVPARRWRDDQSAVPAPEPPSVVHNTTNVYAFIYPVPDKPDEGTASGGPTVSPEGPQSPESSTHD